MKLKTVRIMLVCLAVLMGIFLGLMKSTESLVLTILALCCALAFWVILLIFGRCPYCGGHLQRSLFAKHCKHCGASLREDF